MIIQMRYFVGLSCEEYHYCNNISFCHGDLELLRETLISFCDYKTENMVVEMLYIDAPESNCAYWYDELEKICQKLTKEDTLLFFFAGHGMVKGDDAFLLLPNSVPDAEFSTALSLTKINSILKKAGGNTFKIIDACHSGRDVRGNLEFGFISKLIDKSWATLASCSERENSYPDPQKEQGIFTYCICDAIKKWKKETKITIYKAYSGSIVKW